LYRALGGGWQTEQALAANPPAPAPAAAHMLPPP